MRAICECRRNSAVEEREEVKDYDSCTIYITYSVTHAGICHSGASQVTELRHRFMVGAQLGSFIRLQILESTYSRQLHS